MDAIKPVSLDTTQPVMSELRQQLPRIASLLDKAADEVAVFDYDYWPREYMWTDFRDRVLSRHGVLEGMPFMTRRRAQRMGATGIGVSLLENRLPPHIKYAMWTVRGPNWDENYIVVAKDDVFKLRRNAIRLNKESSKVTAQPVLADGILDHVVQQTVGFLLKSKEIEKYGVKIKRGVILDGSPGNGKTMLCRYIQKLCSQNNIMWGVVTSADIDDAYEEKSLNDLFTRYPVTFFDDIDISYLNRKSGNGKMACSLLTAMDGMSDKGHLIRIFTTNERVEDLDPAFTRPGRIDCCVSLEKPTMSLRKKLVEMHWPLDLRNGINVDTLLERSQDFSFAELEAIRTILVTNKILAGEDWDLDRAFDEFKAQRAEGKRKGKGVGFQ